MISDLELRLDRLRASYEAYFMGYEKLEPGVQRKEVDRRLNVLRKENFRNTAIRFRLNVLFQKYSTYQNYWQRICRQIEEGTYKRHVAKARARFGDLPGLRRRRNEADIDIDVDVDTDLDIDVDLGELDGVTDDEFLARLSAEEGPKNRDDEERDTVRPAPPAWAGEYLPHVPAGPRAFRMPFEEAPSARDPRTERDPRAWEDPAPWAAPGSRTPGSSSAETQRLPPRARMNSAHPDPAREPAPGTDPAPPPQGIPRSPYFPANPRLPSAVAGRAPMPARGAPQAPSSDLSEDRIRQIYAQYVREKRLRGESTASTSYEIVAKSLRTSSQKLREEHQGKQVDFEVAEKDGRTILRPVVK